jgi:hypothetical protein
MSNLDRWGCAASAACIDVHKLDGRHRLCGGARSRGDAVLLTGNAGS